MEPPEDDNGGHADRQLSTIASPERPENTVLSSVVVVIAFLINKSDTELEKSSESYFLMLPLGDSSRQLKEAIPGKKFETTEDLKETAQD